MSLKLNGRSKLRFESLERRLVMAGDVTVDFEGNSLFITGDEVANQVEIARDGSNNIVVTGLNGETLTGDTSVPAADVRSIVVLLGDGADIVNLRRINIAGSITISAGRGQDRVNVGGSSADAVTLGQDLSILAGSGLDRINVTRASVGRSLRVVTAQGNDEVLIQNSTIGRELTVNLGAGANDLALEDLDVSRGLAVAAGSHVDTIALRNIEIADGTVAMSTGAGNDIVELNVVNARSLNVRTAHGADQLTLTSVTADAFYASMGKSTDRLEGSGSTFTQAIMDGGEGTDTFLGIALSSQVRKFRFEV
jgi:hypothetical protein